MSSGTDAFWGLVVVEGSHVYQQQGTYTVTVSATGPDGETVTDQTATATAVPMPDAASQPITVPTAYEGAEPLGSVSLVLQPGYQISSYVGVGFSLNPVAEIRGNYNGQPDQDVSDYHAQINWGDGNTWDTKTALVSSGTDAFWGLVVVEGSHVYQQAGTYDVVVYVTGPDGQTISDDTASATVSPNPNSLDLGNLSETQWDDRESGYDGTIQISGGSGTYTNVNITGLPTGLTGSVSQNEIVITGDPTQSGTFQLSATVNDNSGDTGTDTFNLTINAPVALGDLSPTEWTQYQPGYDGTIQVTGGTGSYQDASVSGLPVGLNYSLSGGTIDISGTPTQSGPFSLNVIVDDSDGEQGTGSYNLTIDLSSLKLGPLNPAEWNLNQPGYDGTIPVSGGSGSYTNLAVTGLPTGLTYELSGSTIDITGTPKESGAFPLDVSIDDSIGDQASGNYTITIQPGSSAIALGTLTPTQWTVNQPGYAGTIDVSGGDGSYEEVVTGLPSGLSAVLSGGTINITGTPTQQGTFNDIEVKVQDGHGDSGSGTYSLTINPGVTLGPLNPTEWTVNEPNYDGTIPFSGGTGGYQGLMVTGLPAGLTYSMTSTSVVLNARTLQSGDIAISGTPAEVGDFTLTIRLKDGTGALAVDAGVTSAAEVRHARRPTSLKPSHCRSER